MARNINRRDSKTVRQTSTRGQLLRSTSAVLAMLVTFTQFSPNAAAQSLLTTPTPYTPSDNQEALVVDAICVQQLDDTITGLEISGTITEGLGLGAEVLAAVDPTGITEATAIGVQVAGFAEWTAVFGIEQDMQDRDYPECDTRFAGTIEVISGGANITGNSIFQNGLGVVGDQEIGGTLDVTGATALSTLTVTGAADFQSSLTAQSLVSETGVSAYDGAIWLGRPSNAGYDAGISLGGGAFSGAGTGGTAASATHQNAMALGNGALSNQAGAVAVGLNARATALDAVAFGTNATASGQAAIASGAGASASGTNASAYGQLAFASGANSTAVGSNARATQSGAVAVGQNSSATGMNAIAIGAGASATGSVAVGAGANASNGGAAFGDNAMATGLNSAALGPNATATAANSVAIGTGSLANQVNTVSIGAAGAERRLVNMADGIDPFDGVNRRQLEDAVERLERGVASTLAQTAPMLPLDRGQTGFAVGAGYYRGETGFGMRMEHRFDTATDMLLSVGLATAGGSDSTTGQAGFSFRF